MVLSDLEFYTFGAWLRRCQPQDNKPKLDTERQHEHDQTTALHAVSLPPHYSRYAILQLLCQNELVEMFQVFILCMYISAVLIINGFV
mgnify:CR=1 FL=1